MRTKTTTAFCIDAADLLRAKATARELDLSFSAYIVKLIRADQRRRDGLRYREIMANRQPGEDTAFQEGFLYDLNAHRDAAATRLARPTE